MLDTTRVNSQTIHSFNHDKHPRGVDSSEFAYNLGLSLIRPHLEIRRVTLGLQSHILHNIALYIPLQTLQTKYKHRLMTFSSIQARGMQKDAEIA